MKHDELADMFNIIKYMEAIGRLECKVPASKLNRGGLDKITKSGYISNYELVKDGRADKFRVVLQGKINDCNVVRPRFPIGKGEFTKWEKKFLPADSIGMLILTTPKGVIDQREARKIGIGGKILGYIY